MNYVTSEVIIMWSTYRPVTRLLALVQCFTVGLAVGYGAFILANYSFHKGHQYEVAQSKDKHVGRSAPVATVQRASQDGCPKRPLNILVILPSSPSGVIKRRVIRATWLQDECEDVKLTTRFVIGTKELSEQTHNELLAENKAFKDLLFLPNVWDAYENLTAKVLNGLVKAYEDYEFDYVLKTDDDSYVRIRIIAKSLRALGCNQLLYWGQFTGRSLPMISGRWAEKEWNICRYYIPYALGGGYILSRKLVGIIARVWTRLKVYRNEDVSIAAWLAPYKVNKKHDIRFDAGSTAAGCHNNMAITHKVGIAKMLLYHTSLANTGRLCVKETLLKPLYTYNWTLPPSQCCYGSLNDGVLAEIDAAYF